jgi:transposase
MWMTERKVYSAEFKLKAVQLTQLPGKTIAHEADDLGIGRSTLTIWLCQHREQGELAFPGHGRMVLIVE